MRRFSIIAILFGAFLASVAPSQYPADSEVTPTVQSKATVPSGSVAAHLVGRMLVDASGNAQWVGYCPYLAGVTGSLFSGAPSEATAYFTFRSTPFQEQLVLNGNLLQLFPTSATGQVEISVYLNTNPNGSFQAPATFSQGQLLAQLQPQRAMGTFTGSLTLAAGTYDLVNSSNFNFDGLTYNLAQLTPSLTMSLLFGAPVAGSYTGNATATIYSFGGYALAVDSVRQTQAIRR
jgi:hypothetical protein